MGCPIKLGEVPANDYFSIWLDCYRVHDLICTGSDIEVVSNEPSAFKRAR